MSNHRFCYLCGTALVARSLENRSRGVCPACGWVDYLLPKPSAGTLIVRDGCVLLVRRGIDPWKGYWYLPAGYMEVDEDPAQTAERETFEETGLQVRASRLVDVYFFDDDPRGNGLLILYSAEEIGGALRGSPEGQELGFFAPEQIPSALAGGAHDRAIRAWATNQMRSEANHEL